MIIIIIIQVALVQQCFPAHHELGTCGRCCFQQVESSAVSLRASCCDQLEEYAMPPHSPYNEQLAGSQSVGSASASPSSCQEHLPAHGAKKMGALFDLQVRLKKEVLDENMRGNAKQRALVGANSLTGDQWYVQQASRSAHASLLCCPPATRPLYLMLIGIDSTPGRGMACLPHRFEAENVLPFINNP